MGGLDFGEEGFGGGVGEGLAGEEGLEEGAVGVVVAGCGVVHGGQ